MGKIKSKTVKKTANEFKRQGIGFSKDFDDNKKILGSLMPSKKVRNQLAGYLVRVEKQEEQDKALIGKATASSE